jgi:hypothetical protein
MILIQLSRDLFNGFFRSRIGAKVRISIGSNRSCQLIRKLESQVFFFCGAPLKTRPVTYRLDLVLSNGQRPFMKFLMHYPP